MQLGAGGAGCVPAVRASRRRPPGRRAKWAPPTCSTGGLGGVLISVLIGVLIGVLLVGVLLVGVVLGAGCMLIIVAHVFVGRGAGCGRFFVVVMLFWARCRGCRAGLMRMGVFGMIAYHHRRCAGWCGADALRSCQPLQAEKE